MQATFFYSSDTDANGLYTGNETGSAKTPSLSTPSIFTLFHFELLLSYFVLFLFLIISD